MCQPYPGRDQPARKGSRSRYSSWEILHPRPADDLVSTDASRLRLIDDLQHLEPAYAPRHSPLYDVTHLITQHGGSDRSQYRNAVLRAGLGRENEPVDLYVRGVQILQTDFRVHSYDIPRNRLWFDNFGAVEFLLKHVEVFAVQRVPTAPACDEPPKFLAIGVGDVYVVPHVLDLLANLHCCVRRRDVSVQLRYHDGEAC